MITLHTIIYEGNYRQYLKHTSRFFTLEDNLITNKLITVNNVTNIDDCNRILNDLKKYYKFDVVYVNDYLTETKDFFKLNMDEKTVGYLYSIPFFVGILNTKTQFIYHVGSDCLNDDLSVNEDYFSKSVKILNNNDNLIVTTVTSSLVPWSICGVPSEVPNKLVSCVGEWEQLNTVNYNSEKPLEDWWCGSGFSDHTFLGNIEKLKGVDYNIEQVAPFNGPAYGGSASFEYRMAQHLTKTNTFRLIYKNNSCFYQHIPH